MGERRSCHRGIGEAKTSLRGEAANVFDELCRRLAEWIVLAVGDDRFLSLRTPLSVRTLVIPTIRLAIKGSKV
jgi:hypothetical protein